MKRLGEIKLRDAIFLLVSLALAFSFMARALAFDAGYHSDLTRDALLRESFEQDGIRIVQINTYYNDAFEASKAVLASELAWGLEPMTTYYWGELFGPGELRDASDDYMHFDALNNYDELAATWDKLLRNTYKAVKDAERRGDALGLLTALGMSVHQVQDYYAHSNWAEQDWGGDATWFDVPEAEKRAAGLFTTGNRGGIPHDRLHKDDASRPYFEKAYRQAFYATQQWMRLARSWVNADFWNSARLISSPAAAREIGYDRYVSWWIGHWKGPSSKSYDDTAIYGSIYVSYLGGNTTYLNKWKELCPIITGAPDASLIVPLDIEPPPASKWLKVKFNTVYQTDNDLFWSIDTFGDPDFYAKVKVDGVEYLEAMHEDDSYVRPDNWLTLAPLLPEDDQLRLEIDLWDEDLAGGIVGVRGEDDHCDIARDYGRRTWFMDGSPDFFLGGKNFHTDGFRYDAAWYESDGDGDEAACDFRITLDTPRRRATMIAVSRPPATIARFAPSKPVVTDEGDWTLKGDGLSVSWEIPRAVNSPAVSECKYRLRDRDMGVVKDWTSVGTANSTDIAFSLRDGHKYFVDVQARNEIGWSEEGSSDGISADFTGPRVGINSVEQTSAWPLGTRAEGATTVYPNSFRLSLVQSDTGSGFDSYLVWITQTLSPGGAERGDPGRIVRLPGSTGLTLTLYKTDIKEKEVRDGVVVLRNMPYLRNGGNYAIMVKGRDKAGNIGEAATANRVVNFRDATPPPATRPKVKSAKPLAISWEEVCDPESGISEYRIAIASSERATARPDILPWRSLGNAREFKAAKMSLPKNYVILVKAINGVGLESLSSIASTTRLISPAKVLKILPKVKPR